MNTFYPSLHDANLIVVDIETFDPNLTESGPGNYRNDGYILGVAIATDTNFAEYYNLGHWTTDNSTKNEQFYIDKYKNKPKTYLYSHYDIDLYQRQKNVRYLTKILGTSTPKLGTNLKYDIDWLENWLEIKVNGELNDIQIAEPLINENQGVYNLDFLGEKYINQPKYDDKIKQFCDKHQLKKDARRWLYLMPYETVREYALNDAQLPIEIFSKQKSILEKQNLMDLYRLEMDLYPLLLQMRKNGVKINDDRLQLIRGETQTKLYENETKLYNVLGEHVKVNYFSGEELSFILDKCGLNYPLTPKTRKPSITKPWLKTQLNKHPIFGLINNCRKYNRLISTFLDSQIGNTRVNNRIHCSFNQLRGDEYGTISGRFSSSNPNLQFIPKNDADIGKTIRSLFVPEKNMTWIKADYSQIEARIIAHYAMGSGSHTLRERYINDNTTDLHQWCANLTNITRDEAKRINFGIFYGMGINKLCEMLNMEETEGRQFMKMYHNKLPFIYTTMQNVNNRALTRGYVKTILKRRRRFPDGQYTYKALNAIVQGTAADILKKAMVECYHSGLFNVLVPHIIVHDEIDVSKPTTTAGDEALREMKNIMENCIKLKVPIIADFQCGPNWGDLVDCEWA